MLSGTSVLLVMDGVKKGGLNVGRCVRKGWMNTLNWGVVGLLLMLLAVPPQSVWGQAQQLDWILGKWNATRSWPGTTLRWPDVVVEFVKNGNEIRAVVDPGTDHASNLARVITDSFGVAQWEIWDEPGAPACRNVPGRWATAHSSAIVLAGDHRSITISLPVRNGVPPCETTGNIWVWKLTR